MPTLYVTQPGARIEKEYQRLLVINSEGILLEVPAVRVDRIAIIGRAAISTPALLYLLHRGIEVLFLTRSGQLRGKLVSPTGKNLPLRHLQYACSQDPAICLAIGKAIVEGKLKNSLALAHRIHRSLPRERARQAGPLLLTIKEALSQMGASKAWPSSGASKEWRRAPTSGVFRLALPEAAFERRRGRPPAPCFGSR